MSGNALERPAACPSCGAAVRTDVSWCGLCYASLMPEPEPEPTPGPAPRPSSTHPPQVAASDAVADIDVVADINAVADIDAVTDRLLAELAASRDPRPGWVDRLPQSSAGRAGLIVGGVVVGTLALVVAMTLLGVFL